MYKKAFIPPPGMRRMNESLMNEWFEFLFKGSALKPGSFLAGLLGGLVFVLYQGAYSAVRAAGTLFISAACVMFITPVLTELFPMSPSIEYLTAFSVGMFSLYVLEISYTVFGQLRGKIFRQRDRVERIEVYEKKVERFHLEIYKLLEEIKKLKNQNLSDK
jgi:hypothetical protein